MTALVLELDTDEPSPFSLEPVRTMRFMDRPDVLVCRCDPEISLSARSSPWARLVKTGIVGVAPRARQSTVMLDQDGPQPVNVVLIESEKDVAEIEELSERNAVFAYIGTVWARAK
jgi:hypothetical protein